MKVFISADIEGIAGVMRPEQCNPAHADYAAARELMEQEVNAAIDGAFAGGATAVTVADSHAMMQNLRADRLDGRARLVQGKPRGLSMVEGLQHQRYDGLMFIGYHSAAGEHGVLAHTINGRAFYRVSLNGEAVGESDLYAAAAELNVPLWLVSGDDELQRWVAERYPHVGYACVKRAISQTAAESLSPQRARAEIRERAMQQVRQGGKLPVERRFMPPYRLTLMAAKPVLADLFSLVPGVERQDALTVAFDSDNMAAPIRLLSVFSYLATTQN
ncbi:M55 family metallopeptidase [Serratia sp. CY49633]|uniref:M55 family metallopeptidase n=1 Tax=Serratia TaxID=613 RepID=UPI000949B90A|nr:MULTISPECIES: M55 family metallopeptidase [Serratia]AVD63048.1 aminopeptidase [Serratia marcescens]ELL0331199.1 M55 family metallopeptidase [Serratia marcescens]MBH2549609.1 M55 family metallopeptidase [Serratia marcescens]MBH2858073.1 M55 family metallopeptidase [Serratia marcescens]MBH2992111.1 M55 family metallopeptidase [Serratia marcescens]